MENMQFCHSCGIPLQGTGAGDASGNYCGNCLDDTGRLKPKDAILAGIAQWLMMFTPNATMEMCMSRANHYLNAMPEWAEK